MSKVRGPAGVSFPDAATAAIRRQGPVFKDATLPFERESWRREVHDFLQPQLKLLIAIMREETPRETRPDGAVVYERRMRGTSKRNRTTVAERVVAFDGAVQLYLADFTRLFASAPTPDRAPRAGFRVRVELLGGWERWVTYVRDL